MEVFGGIYGYQNHPWTTRVDFYSRKTLGGTETHVRNTYSWRKKQEIARFSSEFSGFTETTCVREISRLVQPHLNRCKTGFWYYIIELKKKFRIVKLKIRKSGMVFHRETTIFLGTMITRNNVDSSQIDSRS